MNLQNLQDEIGRLLGDPDHSRWPLTTLTTRINLGQTEIEGYTSAVKVTESVTVTPLVSAQSVNASTLNVIRIYYVNVNGEIRPLTGITRDKLDYLYPEWNQWSAGTPVNWFYDASLQTVNLVPPPDTTVVSLNVVESRVPATLVNSTDIPFDSNNQMVPYHYAIVHWVVATCFQDDGTPEALAKSKFHMSGNLLNPGAYENQLGRIMSEFDAVDGIPSQIMWRPQGGRGKNWYMNSKADPLGFPW